MNTLMHWLVIDAGETKDKYRDIEKAVIDFLQERVDNIPDITWDQGQRRQALIDILEELRE
jgi:hypothetical protein